MKMRWWILGLAVVAGFTMGLADCGLSLTNVSTNDNTNAGGGCATCPGGTGATGAEACKTAPVKCSRVEKTGGKASSFTITHGCGETATVTAIRQSDGLSETFDNVVTGSELDPGPPGAGGGLWNVLVVGGGSCTVRLDT